MIQRTLKWLLEKRDGKGGFNKLRNAIDGFGHASYEVTNAYIVYALSEAGYKSVDMEFNTAYNEALKSKDPYRMALIANAAFNFNKKTEGEVLLKTISGLLEKHTWDDISIDQSITYSYGKSLKVETASLYLLALLKSGNINWNEANAIARYIMQSRSYGYFGSTQATILGLKALTLYAREAKTTSTDGTIEVYMNGSKVKEYAYTKGSKGKIEINGLETYLKPGENSVSIKFKGTDTPLPNSFDATWNSLTPASSGECNLDLSTAYSCGETKTGETVRLNVKLSNKTNMGLPMSIAVIGIPSGLSLQPKQLREMTEQSKFDYYEIRKNYLVLYYRQFAPKGTVELNFDLRADIPGTYQAPASSAYLYYTSEFKDWQDGGEIIIRQ